MTTREEGFKMSIEYDWVYSKENSISVYGYHTDDLNVVQSTQGEELELIRNETCVEEESICRDYIWDKSPDLKYAIVKVSAIKNNYTFYMRYGRQESYAPTTIFLSCGISLALSIPNMFLHLLNKFCWKLDYFSFIFLIWDLLIHLSFFNMLSVAVYLGSSGSFMVGVFCLILFIYYF